MLARVEDVDEDLSRPRGEGDGSGGRQGGGRGSTDAAAEVHAAPSRTPDAREAEDLAARVRLIEGVLPNVFLGNFLCIAIVATVLHDALPGTFLWPWVAVQAAIGAWRLSTVLGGDGRRDATRHGHRSAIAHATLSGAAWGAFGCVAVGTGDAGAALVAVMVAAGLVGGATALIGHTTTVYLPYALLAGLPTAACLLSHAGDGAPDAAGTLLAVYVAFSVIAARASRAQVGQMIALRFRNTDLLDGLRAAHRRAHDERRRAEAALERERRANRAKSVFLAAASHDLRQPLHSLRLQAAALEAGTRGTAHAPLARTIGRSAGALDELFDAILDVSRLEAGTLRPALEPTPLGELLDALIDQLGPQAAARGLALEADPTRALVHTDPVLFGRALRNLLANALRYTPRGGVRLRVAERADGGLDVEVIDTGIGIDAAERERVFEEFVQLDNPERDRSRGIGLGLSIVGRIAALLGLGVRIGDTPGGGTTAVVMVPAAQVIDVPPAVPEAAAVGATARRPRGRPH